MTAIKRDPQDCTCEYRRRNAIGTYDTVTKDWLPDVPTQLVLCIHNPRCPYHGSDDGDIGSILFPPGETK